MADSAPPTLWSATFDGERPRYERGLGGDAQVDVAVVGAGYTGLWTALALAEADPSLRILVVEREGIGFGASGRNGGWCSALLPVSLTELANRHGREAAIAWQRAMFDTVAEVGRFADGSQIDPQFHRGGTLTFARNPHHVRRLEDAVAEARSFGFGSDDVRLLGGAETRAHARVEGALEAAFTPHCAALHPLRLVHAIAAAAADAGVRILEGVAVERAEPRRLHTMGGIVRADVVVLATEAYTAQLPCHRRDVLPIYSMMIGSEPLTDPQWEEIGLDDRQTFTSATNLVIYGQRTADGRLAFGGRGEPYHFGSRIDAAFDTDVRVRRLLEDIVRSLFPAVADVEFPYHWGGPLAVPRDFHPHVSFDRSTGLASAGGYVGDGVATANLAGRTLADLICGRDTELTRLPWVGHRSRKWEPEPLRWLGVRLVATAAERADRAESGEGRFPRARAAAWGRLYRTIEGH